MDLATIIGLVLGILSLILGFTLEGGALSSLFQPTAALIVFGGTIGAVIVGFPMRVLKKVPSIIKYAFVEKPYNPNDTIETLVQLSNVSRREGLLALEGEAELYEHDHFLSEGVQMVIDGVEADMIEDILTREIELHEESILSTGRMFEAAGGFAPTMGIIGTVMGLVHVLGSLDKPATLGPAIAVAFIATLYGVSTANVIYLPIFNKIKSRLSLEVLIMEMQAEGLLSIQHGENSNVLRKKLMAFLDADMKLQLEKEELASTETESVSI